MDDSQLHQAHILVVDDNPGNVEQLEQLLEFKGFKQVRGTTEPRSVEAQLAEFKPDIILLDLQMPEVDGFAVMQMLQQKVSSSDFLPVIVLTADVTPETRERALLAGAMDFLTKPFEFAEVLLRISNLLRTRFLHLRLREYSEQLEDKVRERTKELKQAQDELIAQERYKAMGQMASGIAHDFNNAVAIIMGYSEYPLSFPEVLKQPAEIKEALTVINTASRDAASIVRRLREFYKSDDPEENPEEAADLKTTVQEAISMTQPKWKDQAQAAGRQIEIETELKSVQVGMAPSKLREILTNLIFNAVDAMPKGGVITIVSRAESGFGVLEIRDQGTGMTDEVRDKCLNMFFSTKGDSGTGLGLGMVNDMVAKHRGRVEITSQVGSGSTFSVYLPMADSDRQRAIAGEWRLDRHLKVLVVDDDPKILSMVNLVLTLGGHRVVSARDGREGLVTFLSDTFDVVITDQAMPNINGTDFIRAIRRCEPDLPVIMLTGFGDLMKDTGEIPQGVDQLISKPADAKQLQKALFELFSESESSPTVAGDRV